MARRRLLCPVCRTVLRRIRFSESIGWSYGCERCADWFKPDEALSEDVES